MGRKVSQLLSSLVFTNFSDYHTVSRALGPSAERLNPGCSSPAIRETSSNIYHVVSGKGHSIINEKAYFWTEGDTFCIPTWYKYQHSADKNSMVYLYRCDDQPMIKALGFYRAEGMDVESLVSE